VENRKKVCEMVDIFISLAVVVQKVAKLRNVMLAAASTDHLVKPCCILLF